MKFEGAHPAATALNCVGPGSQADGDRSRSASRQARLIPTDASISRMARQAQAMSHIGLECRLKIGLAAVSKMLGQTLNRLLGREPSGVLAQPVLNRNLLEPWRARVGVSSHSGPVLLKAPVGGSPAMSPPSIRVPAQHMALAGRNPGEQPVVTRSESLPARVGGIEVKTPEALFDAWVAGLVSGSLTNAERLDCLVATVIELQQQGSHEGALAQGGACLADCTAGAVAQFMARVDGLSPEQGRALLDAVMGVEFSAQIVLMQTQNRLYLSEGTRSEYQQSTVLLVDLIEKLHLGQALPFSPRSYQDQAFREGPLTIPERDTLLTLIAGKIGRGRTA